MEIKSKYEDLKEIRRKGDENIFLELKDKVISTNYIGWILEFSGVKIIYEDDDVVTVKKMSIKDIQNKVKAGDIIEFSYRVLH